MGSTSEAIWLNCTFKGYHVPHELLRRWMYFTKHENVLTFTYIHVYIVHYHGQWCHHKNTMLASNCTWRNISCDEIALGVVILANLQPKCANAVLKNLLQTSLMAFQGPFWYSIRRSIVTFRKYMEPVRPGIQIFILLYNLTGASLAIPSIRLSNFRAFKNFKHRLRALETL